LPQAICGHRRVGLHHQRRASANTKTTIKTKTTLTTILVAQVTVGCLACSAADVLAVARLHAGVLAD
jgi:hypothetical protein